MMGTKRTVEYNIFLLGLRGVQNMMGTKLLKHINIRWKGLRGVQNMMGTKQKNDLVYISICLRGV